MKVPRNQRVENFGSHFSNASAGERNPVKRSCGSIQKHRPVSTTLSIARVNSAASLTLHRFYSLHNATPLRHDCDFQAALINCLPRNYIRHSLFDQADKLISNHLPKQRQQSS
ncbi:hypothetical protein Agabi119p4_10623 [Agaricus bisporus var. burnettii]|uniref:26S proteasome non-ATPase regulatory subunit 3 N-terminal TPR repeats domain-containing protein n=1 Tax=Agaricus bisporus var. burnettii TaxID=192524 RepID=A0A8H7EWK3_AGABI|nr:hypothetical protein Agabi119p4_10623 [Agaricus bisporus var. burnettii]